MKKGFFGWLAVNYKVGAFSANGIPFVNVMDTGGASVQITFPIYNGENVNEKDKVELDIYGRHIVLFAHSFLGLGQTLLSQQFLNEKTCFSYDYPLSNGALGNGDAMACQQAVTNLIEDVFEVNKIC